MYTKKLNETVLEELHRHRELHVGQINAWNVGASITGVAALFAVIAGGRLAPLPSQSVAIWTITPAVIGAVTLFAATVFHWWHHSDQIRLIDRLMRREYTRPKGAHPVHLARVANALGPEWFPAYPLVGAGVFFLACGVVIYMWNTLMPTSFWG